MRYFFANLGVNLVALTCVGGSLYLIVHGHKEGWGYFLFVGLLCAGAVTVGKDKK